MHTELVIKHVPHTHLAGYLIVLFLLLAAPVSAPVEFAIKDGDTVVILGDSITAAHQYSKIIEDYSLLRFP